MILKDFLKQRAKREAWAEKQMEIRMRKAVLLTLEPMFETMRSDLIGLEQRLPHLLKSNHIKNVLYWLYVDWGYSQFLWFANNQPFQKKEDFWKLRLEELFAKFGAEKITEIFGTTLELAKPAIKEALRLADEGKSIDEIQKAIKEQIEGTGGAMSKGRARLIARTEVISASNRSTFEAIRETGVKTEKKWITGGKNIRPTHTAAQNQGWIPYDAYFKVGNHEMQHPGDSDRLGQGNADEVCNCKCTLIFRVIDE